MREILFKAKRIDNGEWVEGYLFKQVAIENRMYFAIEVIENTVKAYEVDENTICQYTGMPACWMAFDNEPQEWDIWEHDLLKVEYEEKPVIAEVLYSDGMYILVSAEFADGYKPLFDYVNIEYGVSYVEAEHMGNIFDNRELLEGE